MITVTIGGPTDDPKRWTFQRELVISNIDKVGEQRGHDTFSAYAVELKVINPRTKVKGHRDTAVFKHRYGDDLLSLVHEAIDALGGIRGVDSDLPKR